MDTKQLKSLMVLAEELHFTNAARRLGISQPALSQQIQRVEEELGVAMFLRNQRQVRVTEPGRLFLSQAASLLSNFDHAVDLTRRLARGQVGHLRVGFVENASFNILPRAISKFRLASPDVSVHLQEMISMELFDALDAGQVDVAFVRPVTQDHRIETRLLLREPYFVALSEDHPMSKARSVELRDIAPMPMVVAAGQKARYLKMQFRPRFERLGFELRIGQEVNQLPAIMALVGAGMGFALMPQSTTSLMVPGIAYRPIKDKDAPQAELLIAWHAGLNNPLVMSFLKTCLGLRRGS